MSRLCFTLAVMAIAASPAMAQMPAGPEFLVNTYTAGDQKDARAAIDRSGRFTITWTGVDAVGSGVYAQRFAADGARIGGEFPVPTVTSGNESLSSVAYGATGSSVVAWQGTASSPSGIRAQRYAPSGAPRGGEFAVNTSTSVSAAYPKVVGLAGGGFAVAWSGPLAANNRIIAQSFDAFGVPKGPEVVVNPTGVNYAHSQAVASAVHGTSVVVWTELPSVGFQEVEGRLFDRTGAPLGAPFAVTGGNRQNDWPDVAMARDGSFIVVWYRDYNGDGIYGRLFSPAGAPLGPEFLVNEVTTTRSNGPVVSADETGNFVVAWVRDSAGSPEVMARRFTTIGVPRSGEFTVTPATTGFRSLDDIVSDDVGNFVVTWSRADGNGSGAFARRFGGVLPVALAVDPASSPQSDGNGVLEPGETVTVQPSWRSANDAVVAFSGTIPWFGGPAGATYGIVDGFAAYGTVTPGATSTCTDCYAFSVSAPTSRPASHWDAATQEDFAPDALGQRKLWSLHVGDTFSDVPRTSPFYRFAETLVHDAVTGGCSATQYCPQAVTTREQMAVFVVVARDDAGDPPPACATPVFSDVPASSPFCRWIEELARVGVVSGCGGGNYCPSDPVSREQMAVFVLRTLDGALQPPACGTPVFADVPASSPFCPWIEELARRNVVTGCGGGNYCPQAAVTREQMAVFISGTFGLQLYGP